MVVERAAFEKGFPRWRRVLWGVFATALLLLPACGSGSKSPASGNAAASGSAASKNAPGSQCVSAADAYLKGYDQLPTALPPSFTPLAARPKPGGTIVRIVNGKLQGDANSADAQQQAAKAIGWTAKRVVFDGTVEDLTAKWEQVIADKPTVIDQGGWGANILQKQFDEAKAAGIVVSLDNVIDAPQTYPGLASVTNGTSTYQLLGQLMANLVMRDSGCKANVAVFNLPFPILRVETDSFRTELASKCPDCKVSYGEMQSKDVGTPAATGAVVSKLQADPSIKYIFAVVANVADGLTTALSQAGITGEKVFGAVPDTNSIKALQDGTDAWWVTTSSTFNGWAGLDGALRAIASGKAVVAPEQPFGVLTPSNVPKGTSNVPTYPVNFEQLLKQVW
jgi:ABC-type sugar transport system substrate-binding protein